MLAKAVRTVHFNTTKACVCPFAAPCALRSLDLARARLSRRTPIRASAAAGLHPFSPTIGLAPAERTIRDLMSIPFAPGVGHEGSASGFYLRQINDPIRRPQGVPATSTAKPRAGGLHLFGCSIAGRPTRPSAGSLSPPICSISKKKAGPGGPRAGFLSGRPTLLC